MNFVLVMLTACFIHCFFPSMQIHIQIFVMPNNGNGQPFHVQIKVKEAKKRTIRTKMMANKIWQFYFFFLCQPKEKHIHNTRFLSFESNARFAVKTAHHIKLKTKQFVCKSMKLLFMMILFELFRSRCVQTRVQTHGWADTLLRCLRSRLYNFASDSW